MNKLQQQKLTRFFHVLDENDDGVLEAADLERIAQRLVDIRGLEAGSERYEAVFARHRGTWGMIEPHAVDGQVTLDAFLAFNEAIMADAEAYDATVRAIADSTFDTLDADGDGRVSVEDHRQFFRAYGIEASLAGEVFPTMDTNGDGYLSRPELQEMVSQFFLSSDPAAPGNHFFGPLQEATARS